MKAVVAAFQPGEGPSRGLLRDYEPSDGTFSSTSGDQHLWQEEEGLTLEYLQRIHDKHEQWLLAGRHPLPAPVHVLDGNLDLETFTRAVRAWAADMF